MFESYKAIPLFASEQMDTGHKSIFADNYTCIQRYSCYAFEYTQFMKTRTCTGTHRHTHIDTLTYKHLQSTHTPTYALTRPLTRTLTHSRIHPLTHSLTHARTHSPTHPSTHSPTHSLTHSLTQTLLLPQRVVVDGE